MASNVVSIFRNQWRTVGLIMAFCVIYSISVPGQSLAQSDNHERHLSKQIFLPIVTNEPITTTVANVESASISENSCIVNEQERILVDLLLRDERQERPLFTCNPILAQVARLKAQDMAQRNYFDHVNPDGAGPNVLIEAAGHLLPDTYSQERTGNNVESIAAGFDSAIGAWNGWLNSDHHRPHVLGEVAFFTQQTEFGVGYYYDSTSFYHHYWVILTAHAD